MTTYDETLSADDLLGWLDAIARVDHGNTPQGIRIGLTGSLEIGVFLANDIVAVAKGKTLQEALSAAIAATAAA